MELKGMVIRNRGGGRHSSKNKHIITRIAATIIGVTTAFVGVMSNTVKVEAHNMSFCVSPVNSGYHYVDNSGDHRYASEDYYASQKYNFTVPSDGWYTFTVYGANGGVTDVYYDYPQQGGKGGKVRGSVYLYQGDIIECWAGMNGNQDASQIWYNGGQGGITHGDNGGESSSGGSSSEVKLVRNGVTTRLIVAGGGGAAGDDGDRPNKGTNGGDGGKYFNIDWNTYINLPETAAVRDRNQYELVASGHGMNGWKFRIAAGGGGYFGGSCEGHSYKGGYGGTSYADTSLVTNISHSAGTRPSQDELNRLPGTNSTMGFIVIEYVGWVLTMNANGGTLPNGKTSDIRIAGTGGTYSVPIPSRGGYDFIEWSLSGAGSYNKNSNIYTFGNGDATLTAVWGIRVTCIDRIGNASGATLGTQSEIKSYAPGAIARGSDWGADTTPNRYYTGYIYSSCSQIVVSQSQRVVYRYFVPITYTVRMYTNTPVDATHAVTNRADSSWVWRGSYYEKQFTYDNTTLPNVTDIYTLTGWNNNTNWYSNPGTNGEASGTQYSPGQKNLTTTHNATINLYPYWNKNTYYIRYDGNNTTYNIYGDRATTNYTGTTNNTTHKYDSTVVLSNNGFNKKGYLFKEWNTKSDGTGTSYSAGQTLSKPNFTSVNGGTFTLYAIWEPIRYSIRFNSNDTDILDYNGKDSYYQEVIGSDGKSTNDIRYDQPITLNDITFERTKDITLADGSIIKDGFDFIGWGNSNNQKSASFNNEWSGINFRDVTVNNTTFDIYALWERPVTIKFNLQGGKYKDREYPSGIVLTATVYNDRYDYTFNILDGLSSQSGNSTTQVGKIHAYGTYDADGINSIYSLRNADGTPERFVGWSTSTNISDLLEDYTVYNPSRLGTINTLNKATNTYERINNLYACWEQVLRLEVSVERTLGSIDYEDGTNHNLGAQNITSANSTGGVTLRTIVRPGEQGEYNIKASGTTEDSSVIIKFEDTVTDIYNNGDSSSTWHDDLNPVSNNPLEENQKHGLDREYNGEFTTIRNKWYTPNYFGTDKSYETSRNKTEYSFDIKVSQPSIYYDYVYGTDETIDVKVIIDVSTGGTGNNGSVSDGGDTTLDELRTRLKIRILD